MNYVDYRSLINFTNDYGVSFQYNAYDTILNIKKNTLEMRDKTSLAQIEDIVKWDKSILRYSMTDAPKFQLLRIALMGKSVLQFINKDYSVDLMLSEGKEFDLIMTVQENFNKFARIKFSIDRTVEITIPPYDDDIKKVFDDLIDLFNNITRIIM